MIQLRIIYPKYNLPAIGEKKQKQKPNPSRCTFTSYTCYLCSFFDASIHTISTVLFHPSMAGELFSGTGLNVTLLAKTLLFSQTELITPLMAPPAISDHHMTCVYCNDNSLLCVSPPSPSTEVVMGTQ